MAVNQKVNEAEQILQTIEMFEVIAQTNPEDYQSLDLLLEAYLKLDRMEDVMRVSKMLADAYEQSGQLPASLKECNFILEKDSSRKDVKEQRERILGLLADTEDAETADLIALDEEDSPGSKVTASLITTSRTRSGVQVTENQMEFPDDDGNDELVRFLHSNRLVSPDDIDAALLKVRMYNADFPENPMAMSLLEEALKGVEAEERDEIFVTMLDHVKMGFLPLDCYDTDRQIVRMLPEECTLGRLLVPFDLISRTLLIATCNPFDFAGRSVVHQSLEYNIQWYFTPPKALRAVLSDIFKLGSFSEDSD